MIHVISCQYANVVHAFRSCWINANKINLIQKLIRHDDNAILLRNAIRVTVQVFKTLKFHKIACIINDTTATMFIIKIKVQTVVNKARYQGAPFRGSAIFTRNEAWCDFVACIGDKHVVVVDEKMSCGPMPA
jgi:hypothetical protein